MSMEETFFDEEIQTPQQRAASLSPREREVLSLLFTGLTSREVAARLFISTRTVTFHCANAFDKLRVHSRMQAFNMLEACETETAGNKEAHLPSIPAPARIKFAAILVEGLIFIGKRHHNIIQTLAECGYSSKTIQQSPQGFVTSTGGFVGREEAARIALDCGQIDGLRFSRRELFSEDLY